MLIFVRPLLGWTLGVVGAAVVAKVVAREWRRLSDDLRAPDVLREAPAQEKIRVLRRDPTSGVYRPE
jgi:hypothetical protein